jgi:hypothetical protein
VRPGYQAFTPDARVLMAFGEAEGFQVGVTAVTPMSNIDVSVTPVVAGEPYFRNATPVGEFPGIIRVYREVFTDITCASGPDAEYLYPSAPLGLWPDALIPKYDELHGNEPLTQAFPASLNAGESLVAYIEFDAVWAGGAEAIAGAYRGIVQVSWDGGAASIPFAVILYPFQIGFGGPVMPTLFEAAAHWGNAASGPICRGHFGGACPDATSFADLEVLYKDLLFAHRLSPDLGSDGFTGTSYDWSAFGAANWYMFYSVYHKTSLPFFPRWDSAQRASTDPQLYRDWALHFASLDRSFDYTCDEPGNSQCPDETVIPERAAIVHAAGAALSPPQRFRTLVTTNLQTALRYPTDIDILVAHAASIPTKSVGDTYWENWMNRGDPNHRLWWYQSCSTHGCNDVCPFATEVPSDFLGWPSYMVDASGVQNRSMQWLSYMYRMGGELYWDVMASSAPGLEPWTNVYFSGGNGDGTLVYAGAPARTGGTHHIPLPSLRLKLIRDGMEDYFYLKYLEDLGYDYLSHYYADPLFGNTQAAITVSSRALLDAREGIADSIACAKLRCPLNYDGRY